MAMDAINEHRLRGSGAFHQLGLHDIPEPFWHDYPFVNVGCQWVIQELSKGTIDERHRTMPEYSGMRHFKNGISSVSRWTGRELKEMSKVLLAVMSDCDDRAVAAGRALLDFMYLAHSSSLTDSELDDMDKALRTFHENKAYFIQQNFVTTEKGFHGIPKIHMIQHYTHLIRQLGTPDGYNTETSERLHIDFAKIGYRASNKVNATKQMALYIQRMEAIAMHEAYLAEHPQEDEQVDAERNRDQEKIQDELEEEVEELDDWYDEEEVDDPDELVDAGVRVEVAVQLDEFLRKKEDQVGGSWEEVQSVARPGDQAQRFWHPVPTIKAAKAPTSKRVKISDLVESHDATELESSLRSFLRKENQGPLTTGVSLDSRVSVWSRVRLIHSPPPFKPSEGPHISVIRAQPAKLDKFERITRPARFDTVMILMNPEKHGVHRYRAGRVRVIFELERDVWGLRGEKLAYVEMFNEMSRQPEEKVGLFTTTRSLVGEHKRQCAVVYLSSIRMTCHLVPKYRIFRTEAPLTIYSDVLQLCPTFYFNIYATYFLYELVRHWSQDRRREGDGRQ